MWKVKSPKSDAVVTSFKLASLLRLENNPTLALHLFLNPNPNPNPNPKPFRYTLRCYDLIISKLGRAKMIPEMDRVLHRLKRETRFAPTEVIFCNIIAFYARARLPHRSLQVFDEMPSFRCPRTAKSVNSLLNALLICREFDRLREVFLSMNEYGIPDTCTYNVLINACCARGSLRDAWNVFGVMLRRGVPLNSVTFATLIARLCDNSMLVVAFRLKHSMDKVFRVDPSVFVYTSLMKGLCKANNVDLAFKLKEEMLERGLALDSDVYSTLISGLFKAGRKGEVYGVLEEMRTSGCKCDTVTYNALVHGYCMEKDFESACRLLDDMGGCGCKPDVVGYNILISGYCRAGRLKEASKLVEDMPRRGCAPDVVTFRTLFSGLVDGMQFSEAALVLGEMLFRGFAPHPENVSKFVDGLRLSDNMDMLWSHLYNLVEQNVIDVKAWENLISTVCKNDVPSKSLEIIGS